MLPRCWVATPSQRQACIAWRGYWSRLRRRAQGKRIISTKKRERKDGMLKSKDRISDRAEKARPYVERAFRDEHVRENVKSALAAARTVYDELLGGRGVTTV